MTATIFIGYLIVTPPLKWLCKAKKGKKKVKIYALFFVVACLAFAACEKKSDKTMNEQKKEETVTGNLAPDKQFLVDNKKKEGVEVTANGLQYKVITAGAGAKPTATNRVKVHYRGSLIDGTQFDSSYDRGEPLTFALNQVIRGWTEGLQLMSVGSKYELYIPSELGYGDRGAGGTIPPGATLIFEIELLDII